MKKTLFLTLLLSGALLSPYTVQASPKFDNAEWNQVFEGKSTKIPSQMPNAKGLVSKMNAAKRQQIVNPYDMKDNKSIELSEYAIEHKKHYASQAQKDFLEATAKEFQKLTGQKSIKLPVYELGFDTHEYPISYAKNKSISITLGWFGNDGKTTHIIPQGHFSSKSNKVTAKDMQAGITDQIIKRYFELCETNASKLKSLSERALGNKLSDFENQANNEIRDAKKKEREARLKDKEQKKIDLMEEKWARIEAREQAGDDGWDPEFEGGDALADEREARRQERQAKRAQNPNAFSSQKYDLDLAMMWSMIEAAVTQKDVKIARLNIPLKVEELLLLHAKTTKRPENIIKRVMELNIDTQTTSGKIRVILACTVNDRFMGCDDERNYEDIEFEAKMQKYINNLKAASQKANKKQKEILSTLINNALTTKTARENNKDIKKATRRKRGGNAKKDMPGEPLT